LIVNKLGQEYVEDQVVGELFTKDIVEMKNDAGKSLSQRTTRQLGLRYLTIRVTNQ